MLFGVFLVVYGAFSVADDLASDSSFQIALSQKNTDVYYLSAILGESIETEFLFDTGSGYLAINEVILAQLKSQKQASFKRYIHAKMANGKIRQVPLYKIVSLSLAPGCVLYDVDAAILPRNTRNILGMNVLKMMDSVSLSMDKPSLTVKGCSSTSGLVASR